MIYDQVCSWTTNNVHNRTASTEKIGSSVFISTSFFATQNPWRPSRDGSLAYVVLGLGMAV